MIQLCGFRNTINQCTGIGTVGSVMEHPVLLAQAKCPDGPLRSRIINRNIRMIKKYFQVFFLIQTVFQSISCFALWKERRIGEYFFYSRKVVLNKRFDEQLSLLKTFLRW